MCGTLYNSWEIRTQSVQIDEDEGRVFRGRVVDYEVALRSYWRVRFGIDDGGGVASKTREYSESILK